MPLPKTGEPAPYFSLLADDGTPVTLNDFKGQPVILYFYPKDDTPGCTTQACALRDDFPKFRKSKAVILGVSPDSVASHVKFRKKYDLPFTLLSDPDHIAAKTYGVWQKKKNFGISYMGVVRTTFVIDGSGIVRNVFSVKRVASHAEDVREAVEAL